MNCIILTPLALEFKAIQAYLPEWNVIADYPYYAIQGVYQGQHTSFTITIIESGSKTNPTTLATEKAIKAFSPDMLILTGIAGGVKDAGIGDIVIATQAYGYESGKETPNGFVVRPNVKSFSSELLQQAKTIVHQLTNKSYNIFFVPIASGDKVIASTASPVYQRIKQSYNDTLALEMEAIGFAEAITSYRSIHGINIRSISDLLDNKTVSDETGTQEQAAANAADFVFEFLTQLNPKSLNLSTMDTQKIQEIAKQTVSLIFPLLKLDSIKEIGKEFKEATNTSIQEMWQLVKPVFIEEFDAEKEMGSDIASEAVQADLQSAVERKLKRSLNKNKEEAKGLALLLEKYQAANPNSAVSISNSKNVIQGSTISAGGNVVVGDQINQNVINNGNVGKQVNIDKNEGDLHF